MLQSITDFLALRKTPRFEKAPPAALPPDDDTTMVSAEEAAEIYDECLAGHTMMLEYRDAKQQTSRRIVTIRSFSSGSPGYLNAVCHERKAPRQFRLDRIQSVIDRYGEVYEPAERYFYERFGFHAEGLFSPALQQQTDENKKIYGAVRDGLLCLSAIAGADDFLHDDETEALLRYCDLQCERRGIFLQPHHVEMLTRHIERFLVPDEDMLLKAAAKLAESSTLPLFHRAASEVLEADGYIDTAESEIYMAVCKIINASQPHL